MSKRPLPLVLTSPPPAVRRKGGSSLPSPSAGLEYVVHPRTVSSFFATTFEQECTFIKASVEDARKGAGLFTLETLLALLDADVGLAFGVHLNAYEFVDGAKHMRNPTGEGDDEGPVLATRAVVESLLAAGVSLQFHQPQQHSSSLHALLAGMEAQLGCLVGANIYITPAGAQGLAPHHDDIEAFVLQLEGAKDWCVYKPVEPEKALPASYSDDIGAHRLEGRTPLRLSLAPADVLYFPRGWIHYAKAPCSSSSSSSSSAAAASYTHSTHVTISTYQRWTWGDFLGASVPRALAAIAAREDTPLLRRGLPRRFVGLDTRPHHANSSSSSSSDGVAATTAVAAAATAAAAAAKHTLKEMLCAPGMIDALVEELWSGGSVQRFAMDFCTSRLPPSNAVRVAAESIEAIGPRSAVVSCDPTLLCVVETDARDVGEGGDETLTIFHCLANTRETHMMGGGGGGGEEEEGYSDESGEDEEGEEVEVGAEEEEEEEEEESGGQGDKAVVFPRTLRPLLEKLLDAYPNPISVGTLANVRLSDGTRAGFENAVGASRELARAGIIASASDVAQ